MFIFLLHQNRRRFPKNMPGLYKFLFSIHYTRGAILGSTFFVRLSYIPLIQPFYWFFFVFLVEYAQLTKKSCLNMLNGKKYFRPKSAEKGDSAPGHNKEEK